MNNNFTIDIVSITPMLIHYILLEKNQENFNIEEFYYNFYLLLSIMRLYKFSYIGKKIEERYNISHITKDVFRLLKLLGTILLFSHFFACIWIIFAKRNQNKH